jgi:hypothetical protein
MQIRLTRARWLAAVLLAAVAVALQPGSIAAQRGRNRGIDQMGFGASYAGGAIPYDPSSFTFARLWYAQYPGWSYDYPDMEQNLSSILRSVTAIYPNPKGSTILRMDDPELMKFPIAYISEPGYWFPNDEEAKGLRTYVEKGGFLIIDDFHYDNEWAVFDRAIHKVLPTAEIVRLTKDHPIYHTFFEIENLDIPYPGQIGQRGLTGEFYGIYEDNDPRKKLIVVICYNMDIGDYMEHSARGFYAVDPTNEAYKVGVNYLIYGFTR